MNFIVVHVPSTRNDRHGCRLLHATQHAVRRHRAEGRDPGRERSVEDLLIELTGSSSPSEHAQRNELSAQVNEALARLPDDMQQVLLWRHVDDLPYSVIAARLGKSEGAARVLYVRALDRLRQMLPGDP